MIARHKTTTAIFAAITALAPALVAAPVQAQAPLNAPLPSVAGETVNLTMEQRHIIKEIVVKELKATQQPVAVAPKPGQAAPEGVVLQPVPVEVSAKVPQVRTHSYFVKDDEVVIVDPKNNKIAAVIK
jgi:hypothetical protein